MVQRDFPQLTPTSRSYRPGRKPETVFESQNGSTVLVQFGGSFVNAEIDLEFRNISDADARLILVHYDSVQDDDYVVFSDTRGLGGMGATLQQAIQTGQELLRYRYKAPPQLQSVYPGISTVRCSFIGLLYGV